MRTASKQGRKEGRDSGPTIGCNTKVPPTHTKLCLYFQIYQSPDQGSKEGRDSGATAGCNRSLMPVGALLSIGPTVGEGGGLFVRQTHMTTR